MDQVHGLKDIEKNLKALPAKIQKNALRAGIRAGLGVYRKEARQKAPKRTGALRRSIKVKMRRAKYGMLQGDLVTGVPYGHLVEFGTQVRHTKSGKSTGAMPARPFFRPAFDTQTKAAEAAVAAKLRKYIQTKSGVK